MSGVYKDLTLNNIMWPGRRPSGWRSASVAASKPGEKRMRAGLLPMHGGRAAVQLEGSAHSQARAGTATATARFISAVLAATCARGGDAQATDRQHERSVGGL